MPVQRLNHAVLYVRDVDRSVAFYTEALGFRVKVEIPGRAAFLQAEGSTNDHDLGLFAVGTQAGAAVGTTDQPIHTIVFACDAGMGSSAMGASVLRNKIKKAGIEGVTVVNKAIANLDDSADLVITQRELTPRAERQAPGAEHVSVDNFMNSPRYDEVVQAVVSRNK